MRLVQFQRSLATRVRTLRERRGLRQDDLEAHGLAWKTIQKIEYGKTDPKASTLLKLAAAFKMTVPELLDFDK